MVREPNSGQMDPLTKGPGQMIRQMGSANFIMLTEMSTKANGLMIRLMGKGYTPMRTALNTMETGSTISNMERVQNNGLMEQSMKANTAKARRMGKESSNSLMVRFTREILK